MTALDAVSQWLAERLYVAAAFDRHELAAAKGATRVSVVWPAKDEAATIGVLVRAVDEQLRQACPLVDELIVVDSGSVDETAAVARAAGAQVVAQGEVLPALGDRPGKGEAMWKSLAVATGDVVVFCDADLEQFDPQLLVGLLGPLLADDSVHFVKACYDRVLKAGSEILPSGGGRVTELVARPLLGRWFPQLAGFVQPLAGEYAARAEVLRAVPFAGSYGVDVGLLVDVERAVGLRGMAQVDGGNRRHRHATDAALGVMSAQVQGAVLRRALPEAGEVPENLIQFHRVNGRFEAVVRDIDAQERPPMAHFTSQT